MEDVTDNKKFQKTIKPLFFDKTKSKYDIIRKKGW